MIVIEAISVGFKMIRSHVIRFGLIPFHAIRFEIQCVAIRFGSNQRIRHSSNPLPNLYIKRKSTPDSPAPRANMLQASEDYDWLTQR